MLVIASGRRTGKTTRLLRMMADNPEMVLVSSSLQGAMAAWDQAQRDGLNLAKHRFMSCETLRDDLRGLYDPQILVDNAELVLAILLGHQPVAVTMTAVKV